MLEDMNQFCDRELSGMMRGTGYNHHNHFLSESEHDRSGAMTGAHFGFPPQLRNSYQGKSNLLSRSPSRRLGNKIIPFNQSMSSHDASRPAAGQSNLLAKPAPRLAQPHRQAAPDDHITGYIGDLQRRASLASP